jgi:DUF4097 and DUF4098 domain-containing protein YvlB
VSGFAIAQETHVRQEGGNWVEETTGSMAAARNLRVDIDAGTVTVAGDSPAGINYVIRKQVSSSSEEKARRQFERFTIDATSRGDTAIFEGEREDWRQCKIQLTIHVPRQLEFAKLETNAGHIEVSGIAGRLEAESGGGNLHLDNIGGEVTAETGGGTIEVGAIGGDVHLDTGGGSIRVGNVKGMLHAETGGGSITVMSVQKGATLDAGGGNIELRQCSGRVSASTGGGNIVLGDIGGPVEIDTGGGSIRLNSASGHVRAETGSGSLELNNVPSVRAETGAGGIIARFVPTSQHSDSSLETSAGDITIYLTSGVKLDVRASIDIANGHEINSDFPEIKVRSEGGDWGSRTVSAEGSVNGGGPVLKVSTTTGSIYFRRAQ